MVLGDELQFKSGTTIQVRPPSGSTWNRIAGLIIIEYTTIGRLWNDLDKDIR